MNGVPQAVLVLCCAGLAGLACSGGKSAKKSTPQVGVVTRTPAAATAVPGRGESATVIPVVARTPPPPSGSRGAPTPPPLPLALLSRAIPSQGNLVVNPGETHVAYSTDPPTSGPHFQPAPPAGIYPMPLATEQLPAFLEQGGVEVLYNKSAPQDVVKHLADLVVAEQGRPPGLVLLAPRPDMPCEVTATAWGELLAFGAPDCQPGASGRAFGQGAADGVLVRQFIERDECRYDPHNRCGNSPSGDESFSTPPPGAPTVRASTPAPLPSASPAPSPTPQPGHR